MARKRCFVIMPFGEKADAGGKTLDFDKIYKYLIKEPVKALDIECIRCDEIGKPGWVHAQMIEHIYQDDIAVVDISTLNPNVFYELGARHALRPSVTVLVRYKGTRLPFNIQGLKVIDYDHEDMESVDETKRKITDYILEGLKSAKGDSLVHDVLRLRISSAPKMLQKTETYAYTLKDNPQKHICITTGDIRKIKGIDIWVNSENTNMQMARFFDRSVSGVIRYLGAERNAAGNVTEDTIALELARIVGQQNTVPRATVIATSSGALAATHSVQRIFHVAAVEGGVGDGFTAIPNISQCVTNALTKADTSEFDDAGLKSILFPLMGAGTARGELRNIVDSLLDAAIDYLQAHRNSRIGQAHFVALSQEELDACIGVLDNRADVKRE